MHSTVRITAGHLLMNDAASGSHPLYVTGPDGSEVSQAVTMINGTGKNVRDGLDPAVRVPWKSSQVVLWPLIAKVIEKKEGVELRRVAESERTIEADALPPRALALL